LIKGRVKVYKVHAMLPLTPKQRALIREKWKQAGSKDCFHSEVRPLAGKKQKDGGDVLICVDCAARMKKDFEHMGGHRIWDDDERQH